MTPEARLLVYERHMECQRRELALVHDEAVKAGLIEPCGTCSKDHVPPFFVLTRRLRDAISRLNRSQDTSNQKSG